MSDPSENPQHSRLGLRLFLIYTLFYAGFVFVNAFAAQLSEWIPFGGLNLAIWWGFALIIFAFVLSMVYGLFAGSDEAKQEESQEAES